MKQISRAERGDILLLMLTALIWASAFSSIKFALEDLGPITSAACRVVIGFFALIPFAVFGKSEFNLTFKNLKMCVFVSLLITVVPFILLFWGLQFVDSGISALLMGTTPFMAMIMGHFFTSDETINRYKLMAVGLAMSGIFLIVGPEALQNLGSSSFLAQLAIIGAAFCYVSGGLFIRKIDMQPIPFTTVALGSGAFFLTSIALMVEGVPAEMPGKTASIALLWLGLFPTGLAYVLRFHLVRKVGISTFSLAMNTIPIFGIIFGAVLLNETVEVITIFSLCLVISGLIVARLGTPRTKEPA